MSDLCVVKVGGSLFDLPDLRERLHRLIARLEVERIVLMPGGGATADAVRALDRTHRLGDEAAHWLAIGALSVNARFLGTLLPEATLIRSLNDVASSAATRLLVLDPLPFFEADEARIGHLPHCWNVTSDSLAVRAAHLMETRELILLKSVTWLGHDWDAAARAGIVDSYFSQALEGASSLHVRVINLRTQT